MLQIKLPYGREFLPLTLEEGRVRGVLYSGIEKYRPTMSPEELVRHALENPIGGPALAEKMLGDPSASITVIPDGVSVIVLREREDERNEI